MKKRLLALALAVLCLTGCSTTQSEISRYNATVYVQGVLDETYSGSPSDAYLKLMDKDAADAEKVFAANIDAEYAQRLAVRFELDDRFVTAQTRKDLKELLRTVYGRARITAKAAVPMDGGRYCVEVTITPVTFFAGAYTDGFKALRENFDKTHTPPTEETLADMDEAQARRVIQRYESAWAEEVYSYLLARSSAITTGSAVTKLVLVSPDAAGVYSISQSDLQDIDDWVLQY